MIGRAVAAAHTLPDGAAARLDAFHALLTARNAQMDLTAVTDAREALFRHYLDSLTALPWIPRGAAVVDIGAGAGFPGVPILLARPDIRMTLLDAQRKRVDFLREAAETVGFAAEAAHARAEDFARARRESFDAALGRAVAPLPILLEWALPLVKVGGRCVLWKGPGVEAEMADAQRVSPLLGGGEPAVVGAPVEGDGDGHVLVIVEKVEPTPEKFPRKAGMAQKRRL